jgi:hypothetical protein
VMEKIAALVLVCGLGCGVLIGQPLRFETSGPPEAGTSVHVRGLLAKLSEREPASAGGTATDAGARVMRLLRAIAARELEAGDREGEAGSRRVVFAAMVAGNLDAMQNCVSMVSARSLEAAAAALEDAAAEHEAGIGNGRSSREMLEVLQLGLRDALSPVLAELRPMEVGLRAKSLRAAVQEQETAAELAALAALLSRPVPTSLIATAEGLAGAVTDVLPLMSTRPEWLTAKTHEELRGVIIAAARTAADADATADARWRASLRLRSIAILARAGAKAGEIDGKSRTGAAAGAGASAAVGAIASAELRGWTQDEADDALKSLERMRDAAEGMALAASGPSVKERDLIAALRPAWRAAGNVDDTRAALMEAMLRGASVRESGRTPAMLNARAAHLSRLRDVARYVSANSVIAATGDDASKSEAGVKAGFEFAARRLRAAGQDLAKASLRQAAMAQIREISLGLSLFAESEAEASLRAGIEKHAAANVPAVPEAGAGAGADVGVGVGAGADWSAMRASATAMASELDAARAAWRSAWSDGEGTRGRAKDAVETQASRDAALARLVRSDRLVDVMHDVAWAFGAAKSRATSGVAGVPRRISSGLWRISPEAAGRLIEGAGERMGRVTAAITNGSAQDADVEAFRADFAAAMLVGRIARLEARAGGADVAERGGATSDGAVDSRAGSTAAVLAVLEFARGPADPDDAIAAVLGEQLAIVSRYAEELNARGTAGMELRTYVNQAAASLLDSTLLAE